MILKTYIKEAADSLFATKQRTFLAVFGIAVGIGSVTAMVSAGAMVEHEALREFEELGTDVIGIRKSYSSTETFLPGSEFIRLADAMDLPVRLASIADVAPYSVHYSNVSYAGKALTSAAVIGTTESFAPLYGLRIEAGRFVSDLDHRRMYCVIGPGIADAMREIAAGSLVGRSIHFHGRLCTVVGVLHPSRPSRLASFRVDESIVMPISAVQRIFPTRGVTDLGARMAPGVHHSAAVSAVRRYFRDKGVNVAVQSARDIIEQMERQMQLLAVLLGAVGSISLVVGGVGVMNVMLVSVTERRREIGIRRALGARHRDIQNQFLIESVILCLLGGLLGVVLGIASAYVIARFFADWTFLIDTGAILTGFAVASGVGIAFGSYPARHAARLDPIAAMRAT